MIAVLLGLSVLIVGCVVQLMRQKSLIEQLKHLSDEAEASKQQIIVEQARNRQLKQEMTNNIAHELKTPVSSIRGYLEILLGDRPVDDEKKRYFLDRCYSQTLRLSDLINDVSLINKLEESADLFPKEHIKVRAVAEEAVRELEEKCIDRHIVIIDNLPDEMVINGNHALLYGIFRNLMENAIHYAGEHITVCMEATGEDREGYHLRFYDTGCGVGEEYLPILFDRFQRIDGGRSRKNGGTGLGLSIVKHAIMFHGGEVAVKNRDGGGLEFLFSLKKC